MVPAQTSANFDTNQGPGASAGPPAHVDADQRMTLADAFQSASRNHLGRAAPMETIHADVVIIGAGGAGLRAAITLAQADPALRVALLSKVYPMRSHTWAAAIGCATRTRSNTSWNKRRGSLFSSNTGAVPGIAKTTAPWQSAPSGA